MRRQGKIVQPLSRSSTVHVDDEAVQQEDRLGENEELTEQKEHICENVDEKGSQETKSEDILEFTKQESQTAIDCLKRRQVGYTKGMKSRRPQRMRRRDERNDERHIQRDHQSRKHGFEIMEKL